MFLTSYDSLTGLLNRTYIFNKINELIQNKKPFTLYYIDIDRFKRVNEEYDPHMGDVLLKKVATQLKARTSSNELLGYLGSNEFILIDDNVTNEEAALAYGQAICSALLEPISMQKAELTLTMSLGICQYPRDGKTLMNC